MRKKDCLDCPFYAWDHQNRFDEMYCGKRHRVIGDPGSDIPKWCPVRKEGKREKGKSRENISSAVSGVVPQG